MALVMAAYNLLSHVQPTISDRDIISSHEAKRTEADNINMRNKKVILNVAEDHEMWRAMVLPYVLRTV